MREQREQAAMAGNNQDDNGTFELSFKPTSTSAKPITIKYSALGALPCLMPSLYPDLRQNPAEAGRNNPDSNTNQQDQISMYL